MRSIHLTHALLIFLLAGGACAAPRVWTSADGQRRFEAEFIKQDGSQVTLRRRDGSVVAVDLAKLHQNDHKWLAERSAAAKPQVKPVIQAGTGVFDTLAFGDSQTEVQKKLGQSQVVATQMDARYMARTGLNGIYQTRETIGGLRAALYFGWDAAGKLNEVSLHSDGVPLDQYATAIKQCRAELIAQITKLHGEPLQAIDMEPAEKLQDGGMLATHLWHLPSGGSILVGTARDKTSYQAVVRFTRETIQAAAQPAAQAN